MIKRVLFFSLTFLSFSAIVCAQNYNMSSSNVSTCAGTFFDSGGNGQYQNNENYTMTFCSSVSGQCVRLAFTSFNTEATFDVMRIYNGPNATAPLLGTYSGTTSPGTVTASSGCLTIVFTSDGSVRSQGWAANISCVPCPNTACATTCSGGAPPANDACSGAQNLGLLPVPAACPNGVAATRVVNTTNLCATAEVPYTSLLGCQPTGNMASPASDVWYTFNITGPTLNVLINGLQTPQVGLYNGTSCGNMIPRGCAIGGGGVLNTSFGGLAAGQYWLQVSGGSLSDQCNFTLTLQNNFDCSGCVITSGLTVNPPPVNGTYMAGQLVNFCYTITDYNQTSVNWLHAVTPTFAAGWDMSTFTYTLPANCSGAGFWQWNPGLVISSATGLITGPGFFYESPLGSPGGVIDANPGNNYGDNNPNNNCDWTFCWSVRTLPPSQCIPGASLNISIDTYGDGESGSWTSYACSQDPITNFFAVLACCAPPTVTATTINCPGGTASATANGQGTSPWTYQWRNSAGTVLQNTSNVAGSNTINNLAPGTYTVVVTDFAGCVAQQSITINPATPIVPAATLTPPTCFDADNGSIQASATGGTSPYTYSWSPGPGSSATLNNIGPGAYTVTITDANGCTASQTFNLTQPTQVTAATTTVPVACNGGNNGSATATGGGGTGPYTYSWSPSGGTAASASGLGAGTYIVTVSDSRGCTATASAVVSAPAPVTAVITGSTNPACGGMNTGTATVSAGGGTPGYTYLWSPTGGTSASASGLGAGNYSVRVTDSRGCSVSTTVSITAPAPVAPTISGSTTPSCNGTANGSATVSVNGGTPGYSYLWTPGGATGSTANNLAAGSYTVRVTDNQGCTGTTSVTINQPAALSGVLTPVAASCNGASNGSLTLVPSGGTAPYTYNWLPSGGTMATANGLSAGNYSVVLTDANGCSTSMNGTITEPPAISYTSTSSPAGCGASDGTASVTPSGGQSPYTYSWSPSGGAASTASGLSAGAYTVLITDNRGCTASASVGVSNTAGPTAVISNSSNITCAGGNNGSATVTASGGAGPYTYLWTPSGGTSSVATGLPAGNFSVNVTDVNGCASSANVILTEPPALTAAIASTSDVACAGGSGGSATALANGGSPGYTYSWSPGAGSGNSVSGLTAGTYAVVITDNNGCTATASATINQPTPLTVAITPSNVTCAGAANGSMLANGNGGIGPYLYNWSPSGGSSASANGLSAGTYTVTITDNNNCTSTATASITAPAPLTLTLTPVPVSCAGSGNGSISASPLGGTGPFTYNWSPSGGTGAIASGLNAGSYTVSISDANGCTGSASATITEPTPLVTSLLSTSMISCFGDASGQIVMQANGGIGPFSYAWSPSGGTTATASGLTAGSYTLTVTDANGCTSTASSTITQPPLITAVITNSTPVLCNGASDGTATVNAGGGTGNLVYTWTPAGGNTTTATGLAAGNYSVTISDANNCSTSASVQITEPPAIVLLTSSTSALCGSSNGTASVIASGGSGSLNYSWNPGGGTSTNASGLVAGNYTIQVTDANGCMERATVNVAGSPPVLVNASMNQAVSCAGGNNGSASLTINQGTAPYTINWSPGGSGLNPTNLTAGFYSITVTDNYGCTATTNLTITEPPSLNSSPSNTAVSCNGAANGSAILSVSGGTPGYTYAWTGTASIDSTASGLSGGNYSVTVTDQNGCTQTTLITIAEPAAIVLLSNSIDVSCFGIANGQASVNASGGVPGYTYSWLPSGGSNANATGLSPGNYSVTVTDATGCTSGSTISISQPTPLNALLNSTNAVSCFGSNDGSASITVSGGTPGYSYTWLPSGGSSASAGGLTAGNYSVQISDANGCTESINVVIAEPALLTSSGSVINNVSCQGGSNGSAQVTASGGTAPYTYQWSPQGGTAAQASGLNAGNYTVVVTDANNCTSTVTVTMAEPTLLAVNLQNTTNISCFGGSNGSIQVAAAGGTPGYTYTWSPSGGNLASASGLTAGNYSVLISDQNGCTVTATATLTEPPPLIASASSTLVSCFGAANGQATASAIGGQGAYSYLWTPGSLTSNQITGLVPGLYTVQVSDGNNCTSTQSVTITQPGALVATEQSNTPATCFGLANGAASVLTAGGTPGYQYSWSPGGGNGSSATGLTAGNYIVTVSDMNACTSTVNITITQPALLSGSLAASTNVSCAGGNNGSLSVNAGGGTAPYSYNWLPLGGTLATASSLGAGLYTITVTDANGCTATTSGNVIEPAPLNSQIAILNQVSCNGGTNGSLSATTSGGTAGYTYSWSPTGLTTQTISNLAAGSYTVTITDQNGCTASSSSILTEPNAIQIQSSSTPALCGSNNGSASVNVSGGVSPYSYSWTPGGGTGSMLNTIAAGAYTATVTDGNGCSAQAIVAVANTGGPTVSIAATSSISCFGGNNGSALASAVNGSPPYNYLWSQGAGTNAIANGLSAGNYSVTVTDANGCISAASINISQPSAITALSSSVPASCTNGSNGSVSVTASGGTPAYTYLWSPGNHTTASVNGLSAGSYTILITDANGCTHSNSVNVSQPSPIQIQLTPQAARCFGEASGIISASINGGSPGYQYSWFPGGGSGPQAANLLAGTYTVTVTDANACTSTATATVTEPPAMILQTSTLPATCGTANGSATVSITNGASPYSYFWSPGNSTAATAVNLTAGNYIVRVTDANSCTMTSTASVTNTGGPVVAVNVSQPVSCFGSNNGAATVSVNSGTAPFSYLWSPGGGTLATISGISAGTYNVTVSDVNGCISAASITLNQPNALSTQTSSVPARCFGSADGSVQVNSSGGIAPYTYLWTPGNATTALVNGLTAGTYTVSITDANGCRTSNSAVVGQPQALSLQMNSSSASCFGGTNGSAQVTVNGGSPAYRYVWSPVGGTAATASMLTAGTYTVTVTDAGNCTSTASIAVNQPSVINIQASTLPASCGSANGSASANVSGGTGPYTYLWTPGNSTLSNPGGLVAGNYTITVTDAGNCTSAASVSVTNTGGPSISVSVNQAVSCYGGNNGIAQVAVSSGTAPYSYSWSPGGSTSSTAPGLSAGSYSVTVTDAIGCVSAASVTITQPLAGLVQTSAQAAGCFNTATGMLNATAAGATPPYSYAWTPGAFSGASVSGVTAGSYTVTVSDANGCTFTGTAQVSQPTAVNLQINSTAANCNGAATGSANVLATGGTPAYSYQWFPSGGTQANATNLMAGTYTVTVTDSHGCTNSGNVNINQPPAINLSTTSQAASCGSANGSVSVIVNGGQGPYTYRWLPGNYTLATVNNLAAGNYTVTITDANGCTAQSSSMINNTGGPSVTLNAVNPVSCFGASNGSASVTVNGGSTPYTYNWQPGNYNGNSANGLSGGSYTVHVTDANGCISILNLTVPEPTAMVVQLSSSPAACGGNNGSATSLVAGGTSPYTYQWSPAGGNSSSASGLTSGNYSLQVTDANGCTQQATVLVNSTGGVNAILQSSTNVSCNGGSDGTASVSGVGGVAPYSYFWSNGLGTNASASGLSEGIYTVQVTDAQGCAGTVLVVIQEPPALMISTTSTPAACNGGTNGTASAFVSGGTAPYSYSWSSSGSSASTASGLAAGMYQVQVTDALGCIENAAVAVSSASAMVLSGNVNHVSCHGAADGSASIQANGGTSPYTYLWQPGGWNTPQVNQLSGGNYSVAVTDANGCVSYELITINEPTFLTAQTNQAPVLCPGQNITLSVQANGGVPPYSYLWNNGVASATQSVSISSGSQFQVTVTDSHGCTFTPTQITLSQYPPLNIVTSGSGNICEGNSTQFSAIASGGNGPYSYSWNNGLLTTSGASFTPANDTLLNVVVTDACGSQITDQVLIVVNAQPEANFLPLQATGCSPVTVTFNNISDADPGSIYHWNLGNGVSSSDYEPTHTYTIPGSYSVELTVSSPAGCSSSLQINQLVNVYATPQASFSQSETMTTLLQPVIHFSNSSSGAGFYQWYFGDNSAPSFELNPIHEYQDTGTFQIQLIVSNSEGCPDTTYGEIRITEGFAVYIPNAFTPNGDGVNDIFKALGIGMKDYDLFILDRWGLNIFHSDKPEYGWDGTVHGNGEQCQSDVYEYILRVRDFRGKLHQYIGHVSLVR